MVRGELPGALWSPIGQTGSGRCTLCPPGHVQFIGTTATHGAHYGVKAATGTAPVLTRHRGSTDARVRQRTPDLPPSVNARARPSADAGPSTHARVRQRTPDRQQTVASVSGRWTVNGRPHRSTHRARQRTPPSVTEIIRQRTKIALTRAGPLAAAVPLTRAGLAIRGEQRQPAHADRLPITNYPPS